MYKAGIVGCGRIGCAFDDDQRRGYVSTHAGAYVRTPEVNLTALSDMDETKLNHYGDKFHVSHRYTDYREMLDREKLDILSICTWSNTHLEITKQAVQAGVKAIFCEKPMTDNLSSADEMIRQCAERQVLFVVDHQRRFDPMHQAIASYVHQGRLGPIQQVTGYYTAGVANTGSHLFDLIRFFFGDVMWVQGFYSYNPSPNPNDPNIDGWLQVQGGPLVGVQACDVQNYTIFEVSILGTKGRLRLMNGGFDIQFEKTGESKRFSGYHELVSEPSPIDSKDPHEFMLQGVGHVVDCLIHKRAPVSRGEDGRRALEIICALHESAKKEGQRIHLPLQDSPIILQSR